MVTHKLKENDVVQVIVLAGRKTKVNSFLGQLGIVLDATRQDSIGVRFSGVLVQPGAKFFAPIGYASWFGAAELRCIGAAAVDLDTDRLKRLIRKGRNLDLLVQPAWAVPSDGFMVKHNFKVNDVIQVVVHDPDETEVDSFFGQLGLVFEATHQGLIGVWFSGVLVEPKADFFEPTGFDGWFKAAELRYIGAGAVCLDAEKLKRLICERRNLDPLMQSASEWWGTTFRTLDEYIDWLEQRER